MSAAEVNGRPQENGPKISMMVARHWVWLPSFWLASFGLWPLADPGHSLTWASPLIAIDLAIHGVGWAWFITLIIGSVRRWD